MAYTFDRVWRRMALEAPLVPVSLLQGWCRDVFNDTWDWRPWSASRVESAIQVTDALTGTLSVVNGSTTVTLDGTLAATAAAVGRQLQVTAQLPIGILVYTNAATDTLTLEVPYMGPTASLTQATVLDAWVTMPADFQSFIAVWDPTQQIDLWYWATELDLNRLDPGRTSTGDPFVLASRSTWGGGATVPVALRNRLRYELWPYLTTQRGYPMLYKRRPPALASTTVLPEPFGSRMDWWEELVMAKVCKWPGTEQRRNPHFGLPTAQARQSEGLRIRAELELVDEDRYPSWYLTRSARYGMPIDSNYRQGHDWSAYGGNY
jgi:hypothetical protein